MTRDIHVLQQWIRAVTMIAAICTTSLPILYAFSPWYKTRLGRLFMAKAISFAVAMDLTCLFMFWTPTDILVIFWVDAIVLTAIAISTTSMAWFVWRLNFPKKRKGRHWRDQE